MNLYYHLILFYGILWTFGLQVCSTNGQDQERQHISMNDNPKKKGATNKITGIIPGEIAHFSTGGTHQKYEEIGHYGKEEKIKGRGHWGDDIKSANKIKEEIGQFSEDNLFEHEMDILATDNAFMFNCEDPKPDEVVKAAREIASKLNGLVKKDQSAVQMARTFLDIVSPIIKLTCPIARVIATAVYNHTKPTDLVKDAINGLHRDINQQFSQVRQEIKDLKNVIKDVLNLRIFVDKIENHFGKMIYLFAKVTKDLEEITSRDLDVYLELCKSADSDSPFKIILIMNIYAVQFCQDGYQERCFLRIFQNEGKKRKNLESMQALIILRSVQLVLMGGYCGNLKKSPKNDAMMEDIVELAQEIGTFVPLYISHRLAESWPKTFEYVIENEVNLKFGKNDIKGEQEIWDLMRNIHESSKEYGEENSYKYQVSVIIDTGGEFYSKCTTWESGIAPCIYKKMNNAYIVLARTTTEQGSKDCAKVIGEIKESQHFQEKLKNGLMPLDLPLETIYNRVHPLIGLPGCYIFYQTKWTARQQIYVFSDQIDGCPYPISLDYSLQRIGRIYDFIYFVFFVA